MEEIKRAGGDAIAGMTPTLAVPAMLSFQVRDQWVTRQVMFIGIDEETHASVSDFGRYLQHPGNREKLSFQLREAGYDTVDSQSNDTRPTRPALANAGWPHRRDRVARRCGDRQPGLDEGPQVQPEGAVVALDEEALAIAGRPRLAHGELGLEQGGGGFGGVGGARGWPEQGGDRNHEGSEA